MRKFTTQPIHKMSINLEMPDIDFSEEQTFNWVCKNLLREKLKGKLVKEFSNSVGIGYVTVYSYLGGKTPKIGSRKFFIEKAFEFLENNGISTEELLLSFNSQKQTANG